MVLGVCALAVIASKTAHSQGAPNCFYANGLPSIPACGANPNPNSIPHGMGGNLMAPNECKSAKIYAIASLYSYDDPSCHPVDSDLPPIYSSKLKFEKDAADILPENWKRIN